MSLIQELKRRNVFRVGIAYLVGSWLLIQVADILLETFEAPTWSMRLILLLLAIGLPLALFFAWAFELTPEGIKREQDVDRSRSITRQTGRKLDFSIIFVLVVALAYFVWDKYALRPAGTESPPQEADSTASVDLPKDRSIAVLPFENRSRLEDDAFFTAGIHDDLLTQLAQISSLRVISRTSVVQFEDTSKSIREIAELLNVATILEGGVQRAGDQVRINLQLIDAATDAHLWAQTFDRELTANNIFAIQSEITQAVTEALRATLTDEEQQRIADVPTDNMEALEEYFRGRAEMDTRTLDGIQSARLRFQRARELDPDFALALSGEAQAILLLEDSPTSYGELPRKEVLSLAQPLVNRALELAPDDPQVLGVAGLYERRNRNLDDALAFYRRSLDINPTNGEVMNWHRMALFAAGHYEEGVQEGLRMIEADPMSMITLSNGIFTLASTRYTDAARLEELMQRLETLDASYGLEARSGVAALRGDVVDSVRFAFRALAANNARTSNRRSLAETLFSLGLPEEAVQADPSLADDAVFYSDDWEGAVTEARRRLEENPESIADQFSLFNALFMADRAEEAFAQGEVLWSMHSDNPSSIGFLLLRMARVAQKTEHVGRFEEYRRLAAEALQGRIEAGDVNSGVYYSQAVLGAIDQRPDDAIEALRRAIDLGVRWTHFHKAPTWDSVRNDPRFQAQVSRMRDLVTSERAEIASMLCADIPFIDGWVPAPETCESAPPKAAGAPAPT